jgi:hypothetical protein
MPDYAAIAESAADPIGAFRVIYHYFHTETHAEYMQFSVFRELRFNAIDAKGAPRVFVNTLTDELEEALTELLGGGWIDRDGEGDIILTRKAFLEPFRSATGSVEEPKIPAADRFVRVDHNHPQLIDAGSLIEKLESELDGRNDLPIESDEARALLSEIRALLLILREKFVRLSVIAASVSASGTLGYLQGRFRDHALAGLIGAAIAALLRAFGIG